MNLVTLHNNVPSRAVGHTKCNRTTLPWLYGYYDIYWSANVVSTHPIIYTYSII